MMAGTVPADCCFVGRGLSTPLLCRHPTFSPVSSLETVLVPSEGRSLTKKEAPERTSPRTDATGRSNDLANSRTSVLTIGSSVGLAFFAVERNQEGCFGIHPAARSGFVVIPCPDCGCRPEVGGEFFKLDHDVNVPNTDRMMLCHVRPSARLQSVVS